MGTKDLTVQEGINIGLGTGGSSHMIDGTAAVTLRTIAITMIADTTFTTLTSASGNSAGTAVVGSSGAVISTSLSFPAGITIYGDWTTVDVSAGSVILYHG